MPAQTSLPVRGAWVEIRRLKLCPPQTCGRSPCGERGLKWQYLQSVLRRMPRRSPCGERGLKSPAPAALQLPEWLSLPVRGAWVEIKSSREGTMEMVVAPRAGSVG